MVGRSISLFLGLVMMAAGGLADAGGANWPGGGGGAGIARQEAGGCGCSTGGLEEAGDLALVIGTLASLVLAGRRRRKRAP